ncbi:MAG TPA: nucleotidyltransferase family protein [Candidatus Dormibacteraeota bacterium]
MIGGLILAAGEGTRFGSEPKLLAELGGRPLLEHAVRAQCRVPALERVVVVLGAHADRLLAEVDFMRAEPVVCDTWAEGQSASLRRGLRELQEASKVIVTLGDEPLITSETVARFAAEPPGTQAVYDGRPGHPVVLGPDQLRALLGLTGDRGARDLLAGGPKIELGDRRGMGRDVDTTEDLERMRNEARAVV